eukprot:SAG11_NODE_5214_length_1627_cov_7.376963_2_plen_215_part_00
MCTNYKPIDAILGRGFLEKSRGFLAFFVDFEKITRGDPWFCVWFFGGCPRRTLVPSTSMMSASPPSSLGISSATRSTSSSLFVFFFVSFPRNKVHIFDLKKKKKKKRIRIWPKRVPGYRCTTSSTVDGKKQYIYRYNIYIKNYIYGRISRSVRADSSCSLSWTNMMQRSTHLAALLVWLFAGAFAAVARAEHREFEFDGEKRFNCRKEDCQPAV